MYEVSYIAATFVEDMKESPMELLHHLHYHHFESRKHLRQFTFLGVSFPGPSYSSKVQLVPEKVWSCLYMPLSKSGPPRLSGIDLTGPHAFELVTSFRRFVAR